MEIGTSTWYIMLFAVGLATGIAIALFRKLRK